MPLVTVVVPVRDRDADVIERTLGSIFIQDEFVNGDMDVVVVDDGSVVPVSCDRDGVRVVRNDVSVGVGASLNRGLELSGSEFIARLDAGDLMMPGRVSRQLVEMDSLDVCAGGMAYSDGSGILSAAVSPEENANLLWFGNTVCHPSVLMRRSALPDGYPVHRFTEDWAAWLEATTRGVKIGVIPDVLVNYESDFLSETAISSMSGNNVKPVFDVFRYAGLGPAEAKEWALSVVSRSVPSQSVVESVSRCVPSSARGSFVEFVRGRFA